MSKNKTRNIYVVGGDTVYANWMKGRIVQDMAMSDLVVFTGGEDVDPDLYNCPAHPRTSFNRTRDDREIEELKLAIALNLPLVGICRGSQFLCAMAGGELVQHQENPSFVHPIITHDGRSLLVSSTHHQAQFPWDMDDDQFKVLAWSEGVSRFHQDGLTSEMVLNHPDAKGREVEIAYYKAPNALAIQSHPEMIYDDRKRDIRINESIEYMQELLNLHMEGKLS